MPADRIYGDDEISAVLKRAADLQRERGTSPATGLSLSELRHIGEEAGIDPDLIVEAARELETRTLSEASGQSKKYQLLGGPVSFDLERTVDGHMDDETQEAVAAEFRRVFGAGAEAKKVGRTLELIQRDDKGDRVHVTVTPTGERTTVRVYCRMDGSATVIHAPITVISIMPVIIQFVVLNLGPVIETGFALFLVFAVHMLARALYGSVSRKQERRARQFLSHAAGLVAERAGRDPNPEIGGPAASRDERIDSRLLETDLDPEAQRPARPSRERER